MTHWRGNRFKTEYLPLVRPFSAVSDLLRRVRNAGLQIAVASSAKKDEVDKYLDIARITDLVDLKTSSDDVEESKPAPDIFEIVLKKLKIEGADAVANHRAHSVDGRLQHRAAHLEFQRQVTCADQLSPPRKAVVRMQAAFRDREGVS
nr:HAD hydrolase-like protein [Bradyrhizobium sp.]